MSVELIAARLNGVRQRIAGACRRSGREPGEVSLLPVSKTRPASEIRDAVQAGLTRFGENIVREARGKAEETRELPLRWRIVGHLQSNKTKWVAEFAHEVHSLDRLKVARQLDSRLQLLGRGVEVLIQVNTSNEPQKFGLQPDEVLEFSRELDSFSSLSVKGLMTLALFSADEETVRPCFSKLRLLRDRLRQDGPSCCSWEVLSMGMSADLEIAVEEGATEVRVGQAIFGERAVPDSYYWS